ncbi:hypothetical protein PR048_024181 [Dryococelus australis]|uniref:Uncharacterized protein n=1 Tax=Dryococelus australis TaxID=614101 RepID=A0ABQ9GW55_9NEOP|nr:hypothetical protein PR048_024181 [Dryococelus australis]
MSRQLEIHLCPPVSCPDNQQGGQLHRETVCKYSTGVAVYYTGTCHVSWRYTWVHQYHVQAARREDSYIERQSVSTPREWLCIIQGHVTSAGDTPVSASIMSRRLAERTYSTGVAVYYTGTCHVSWGYTCVHQYHVQATSRDVFLKLYATFARFSATKIISLNECVIPSTYLLTSLTIPSRSLMPSCTIVVLYPRSDLRSTQKTIAPFEFRTGPEIEMKFISNRRNWQYEISIRDQQPSSTNGQAPSTGRQLNKPAGIVTLYTQPSYERLSIRPYTRRCYYRTSLLVSPSYCQSKVWVALNYEVLTNAVGMEQRLNAKAKDGGGGGGWGWRSQGKPADPRHCSKRFPHMKHRRLSNPVRLRELYAAPDNVGSAEEYPGSRTLAGSQKVPDRTGYTGIAGKLRHESSRRVITGEVPCAEEEEEHVKATTVNDDGRECCRRRVEHLERSRTFRTINTAGADSIAPRRNRRPTSPSLPLGTMRSRPPVFPFWESRECRQWRDLLASQTSSRLLEFPVHLATTQECSGETSWHLSPPRRITRVGEDSSGRQSLTEAAWRVCANEVKCGRQEIAGRRRVRCSWLEWTRGCETDERSLQCVVATFGTHSPVRLSLAELGQPRDVGSKFLEVWRKREGKICNRYEEIRQKKLFGVENRKRETANVAKIRQDAHSIDKYFLPITSASPESSSTYCNNARKDTFHKEDQGINATGNMNKMSPSAEPFPKLVCALTHLSIIMFLAQHNLAFRRSSDKLFPGNGNFPGLVELLGNFDYVMREHLRHISAKSSNDHHCGKTIQNYLMNILGEAVLENKHKGAQRPHIIT